MVADVFAGKLITCAGCSSFAGALLSPEPNPLRLDVGQARLSSGSTFHVFR